MTRTPPATTQRTADGSDARDDAGARRIRGLAQAVAPFAGRTWVYAGLLAAWGSYELRPAGRR